VFQRCWYNRPHSTVLITRISRVWPKDKACPWRDVIVVRLFWTKLPTILLENFELHLSDSPWVHVTLMVVCFYLNSWLLESFCIVCLLFREEGRRFLGSREHKVSAESHLFPIYAHCMLMSQSTAHPQQTVMFN
jgi:hypothetical protein